MARALVAERARGRGGRAPRRGPLRLAHQEFVHVGTGTLRGEPASGGECDCPGGDGSPAAGASDLHRFDINPGIRVSRKRRAALPAMRAWWRSHEPQVASSSTSGAGPGASGPSCAGRSICGTAAAASPAARRGFARHVTLRIGPAGRAFTREHPSPLPPSSSHPARGRMDVGARLRRAPGVPESPGTHGHRLRGAPITRVPRRQTVTPRPAEGEWRPARGRAVPLRNVASGLARPRDPATIYPFETARGPSRGGEACALSL